MNPYTETLVQELEIRSIPEKAEWWNSYMKGVIRFVGISVPEIRKLLYEANRELDLDQLPMNQQVSMVNGLMRSSLAMPAFLVPVVIITALQGETELFTADPIRVTATV